MELAGIFVITQYARGLGVERLSVGVRMQFRDETVPADSDESADGETDESRMWFVRLRIRDDRLAKLWVWKLTDHDVIVWSESEERWKRLMAVPELRAAVRRATTSAYARKNPASEAPQAPSEAPVVRTKRQAHPSLAELDFDESPTRLHATARAMGYGDEESPTRVRARPFAMGPEADRPISQPPPKPVDPLLHALTTSIPPAVHSTPAPEIPRAPRLPGFFELSPQLPANVTELPRIVRSVPRAISQFSIKNISWAMVPVACAGIFAVYVNRNSSVIERTLMVTQQSAASTNGAPGSSDSDATNERLATLLVGAAPICAGQPQQPPRVLSPEQLAAIPNSPTRAGGSMVRSTRAVAGIAPAARRSGDKSLSTPATSGAGAAPVAVETNEFDREGAKAALKFAIARVRNCSNSGLSGSALITFTPSGTVQHVQLNQVVGDDVDPSCVIRALSASRVPPFTGSAVTVRKSF